MDDDGFFVGELNGRRGLVPSNFLTDVPSGYDPAQLARLIGGSMGGNVVVSGSGNNNNNGSQGSINSGGSSSVGGVGGGAEPRVLGQPRKY